MPVADSSISPPPVKRRRLENEENCSSDCLQQDTQSTKIPSLAPSLILRPITTLSSTDLRIFSWNINGISTFLQPSISSFFPPSGSHSHSSQQQDARNLHACLGRWKWPQIVCLQEVKIARKDIKTQAALSHAVAGKHRDPKEHRYSAIFSLPRDPHNARGLKGNGKIYGVCTLLRSDFCRQEGIDVDGHDIREVDWDLEGRVLIVEMPLRKLAVINVYAVNGTENPYRNPGTGEIIGNRHHRKRDFHTCLKREVEAYEGRGWKVVVAGDMNVARAREDGFPGIRLGKDHAISRADFETKFMNEGGGLGMKDTFREVHRDERRYSYRPRGMIWGESCDRVDTILLSKGFEKSALAEADILDDELERGPSDHCPLYVTLKDGSSDDNQHSDVS
ncbi:hypothetical protein MMC09_001897 [Bachmanniomyces sp. S44760]|nr:hypothetical protein [Bachmanniomyces sp. S44760]